MKKILGLLFILAISLGIVACNGNNGEGGATASFSGVTDVSIDFGSEFDPLAGVTATDSKSGAIDKSKITVVHQVNTSSPGTYTVTYKVKGSDGVEVIAIREVTVRPQEGVTASFAGVTNATIAFGTAFDPLAGVTATDSETGEFDESAITIVGAVNSNIAGTYTLTYKVTGSDGIEVTASRTITVSPESSNGGPPIEIVIAHGDKKEIDPFDPLYSGTEQNQRQQLQLDVEERYNVNVTYKNYHASAAWGPSRVNAIIQGSVAGEPLADILWITSDWIQALAIGDAIVPVDQYLHTSGVNIHQDFRKVGSYNDLVYAFSSGNLTVDVGLFYNADLIAALGAPNPSEMFLAGNWTWSSFETWATNIQTQLSGQEQEGYAIGGVPVLYAESMIPLNGGKLINGDTGRVAFNQAPALATLDFLSDLWTKGLFEPAGAYDAGSALWMAGRVAIHPGSLWFVNADNRWGNISFELGYVPYPRSDTYNGQYASPISGVAVYSIASGMTPEREALVFEVWNELQLWKTEEELRDDFEITLMTRFDKEVYVEAYMAIYDKVYYELIGAVGISHYGENGWRTNAGAGIREGTARTNVDSIAPIYQAALTEFLNPSN